MARASSIRSAPALAAAVVASASLAYAPLHAAPGGSLGTLPRGDYVCGVPGYAGGKAWIERDEANFRIVNGSSYRTPEGRGTYLLAGDNVRFTRGPMKGRTFLRETMNRLREIGNDGELGRMRCSRRVNSR
ncbi:elongation factor P [Parapontixanthobacter aurantiacus]|uniref:elongation factor P n=1 Tax=Parapontixanthobacter aurantiacus TaxID=1463599 RepID=UPI0019255DE6|nr:elongation factor P [Parapontixanthobacter aurantiacus]